jgi:hypothetical protein
MNRIIENLYNQYPDNNYTKDITAYIDTQSFGRERHVFIGWENGEDENIKYVQQLHLTGNPGNYNFYEKMIGKITSRSISHKSKFIIATLDRQKRDELIKVAKNVKLEKKSKTRNCQDWLKDLLNDAVKEQIIEQKNVDEVLKNFKI